MDAIPFYKLVRLLPVALVCFLTTPLTLEAKESSTTESTNTRSALGTLVIVAAEAADPSIQQVNHQEVVAAGQKWKKAPARQARQRAAKLKLAGPIAEMLVYAHKLSQTASTEADYEEIEDTCDTAERLGVSGDQLNFSLQLHAWATKHCDQMRIDRIQQQLRAEKAAQQLRARRAEQKLHVQRAKQQLLAAEAEEDLRAEKIQQQLRAEKAEQKLRAMKVRRRLRAEVAEQQLRAERAELELAEQELTEEGFDARAKELVRADLEETREETHEETTTVQSPQWQQLHDRGVTFAEQGKYAEAMDDFNRVLEINPMFAKAYANRATLFTQSGDLERAQADYQRACTLDPELLHPQVGLGRVYHLLGLKEEALGCFNRAVELDPDYADITCSRADLLADMGHYRDALADYARAIDLDPEFSHAYRNGSWLLATCPDQRFRDPANAVRGAQRALNSGYGARHVALDTLAAAQASAGDFDLAIETLQEALKIAPHEARYTYRSRLQMYQGNQSFFTEPVEDVSQVVYEVSDR